MIRTISKGVKKYWASLALISAEMIIVIVLFVIAVFTFTYIVRGIFYLERTQLDDAVFAFMNSLVNDRNNAIMKFITLLGTHYFLIPANLLLIAYYLFIRKHKWYSIKIPAIAISSVALMFILKNLFNRPRPDLPLLFEAKGLSFPSGHALMSVTFYGLLIYIVYNSPIVAKPWKVVWIVLLVLLIIMIGMTRIYLRVHYASDVIAGYSMGFLWLVFAVWMLNRMEKYSRRKIDPVVQQPPVPEPANN